MVQISVLAHNFSGEEKKDLWHAFTRVFRPGTKLYSRLGSTSSILWGKGLKMHSSGTGLLLSFATQSSLGGTFLAQGGTAPKCPPIAPDLTRITTCLYWKCDHWFSFSITRSSSLFVIDQWNVFKLGTNCTIIQYVKDANA